MKYTITLTVEAEHISDVNTVAEEIEEVIEDDFDEIEVTNVSVALCAS